MSFFKHPRYNRYLLYMIVVFIGIGDKEGPPCFDFIRTYMYMYMTVYGSYCMYSRKSFANISVSIQVYSLACRYLVHNSPPPPSQSGLSCTIILQCYGPHGRQTVSLWVILIKLLPVLRSIIKVLYECAFINPLHFQLLYSTFISV